MIPSMVSQHVVLYFDTYTMAANLNMEQSSQVNQLEPITALLRAINLSKRFMLCRIVAASGGYRGGGGGGRWCPDPPPLRPNDEKIKYQYY